MRRIVTAMRLAGWVTSADPPSAGLQRGSHTGDLRAGSERVHALVQDDLRPVFEMHGVVVVPLATPDEAVLLENLDDLPGNLVSVEQAPIGVGLRPAPIVRVRGCNIDGDPQTVRALAIRSRDQTAVVGALAGPEVA